MEVVILFSNIVLAVLVLFLSAVIFGFILKGEIGAAVFTFSIFILPMFAILYALNRYNPKISQKKDDFNGVIWLYTSKYKGCRYRALLKDDILHVIQLYIETNNSDWVYFNSAHGEDKTKLEFTEVDSDVKTHGFGEYKEVRTHEIFALDIPFEYLERMSTKDWKIKAYGKRGDRVFTIPKKMSQPFYEYIKPYIIANKVKV